VPKLLDCFLYNNERQLLEVRLQLLEHVVDRFVIVWAAETFTGIRKEGGFPWDSKVVQRLKDRIDLVAIDKLQGATAWEKESHSRNSLADGLRGVASNDLVVVSDVDEIPRPEVLRDLRAGQLRGLKVLATDYYNFNINYQLVHGLQAAWAGPVVCDFASFTSPQALRDLRWSHLHDDAHMIYEAGWHFSFLTDTTEVREKLASFSHQEVEVQERTDSISKLIETRQGFHDHMNPASVWAVISDASFRCDELVPLVRAFPSFFLDLPPDADAIVQRKIKLSVARMETFEREKMLRWFRLPEIRDEIVRRVRRNGSSRLGPLLKPLRKVVRRP
jgi:beta-1,4-mannosyl-glycoprotein beta-1,4-N-acetylglucosaminyltransferase